MRGRILDRDALRRSAIPVSACDDVEEILDLIGDASLVLIGEASHGTAEFYRMRAALTRRLIEDRGFVAVAAEADWPDAQRVDRFVRGSEEDPDAASALGDFRRFPTWMWANTAVRDFTAWLRDHNAGRRREERAGFYGMDLYSLQRSRQEVIRYLEGVDAAAAARARDRYSCFDPYREDLRDYGFATPFGEPESCEDEVVGQLVELRGEGLDPVAHDGRAAEEAFFSAERNARVVERAEAYYRAMYRGGVESWNLRDHHMAEMLEAVRGHVDERTGAAKVAVWAHNSHLGDARATAMGESGELNLGQLVRERHDDDAFLLGFTTYEGTVTAARGWDEPGERRRVRPALPDSYEALFHELDLPAFLMPSDGAAALPPMLERAIGVVYRPETERASHYFRAHLSAQFDAVVHVDRTSALEPLEPAREWRAGEEPPQTYPWAV